MTIQISDILSAKRVRCDVTAASKKSALESLAELISSGNAGLTQTEVLDSLITRERLGSTGLGHGIALPHGRLKHGTDTLGAFIRLAKPISFDSIDNKPVDLLFALLVPEESTQAHLEILSKLAEKFSSDEFLAELRSEKSNDMIYQLLIA